MQTRVLGLVLCASCYLPMAEPEGGPARAERGASVTAADCLDPACTATVSTSGSNAGIELNHVRTVHVEPSKPNTSTLSITIAIPATTVDCGDVLLSVVGAKRALLGESIVLEAAASGPEPADDSDPDYKMPSLQWTSTDAEVTVIGPTRAEVSCDALGVHAVSAALAPPAPCPAAVHVQVECIEAEAN